MTPPPLHISGPVGWIKLHRQLLHHQLWQELPFDRARAWVDLLLLANFADSMIRKRGIKVEVRRGQVGLSERELAERWGWSRGKVRRFLNELETVQQIEPQNEPQKNNVTSLITITNFDRYQIEEPQNEPANGTTDGPQTGRRIAQNADSANKFQTKKNKKKKEYISSFSTFWEAYPRKAGKAQAEKSWAKLNPDSNLQGQIFEALDWQTQQPDWQTDSGKFIPHAATWLNGRRWEDEQPQGISQNDGIGHYR